jgi:hypothetical protein
MKQWKSSSTDWSGLDTVLIILFHSFFFNWKCEWLYFCSISQTFFFLLLFICAYKAWFISPPCPHPLPYHPFHPPAIFFIWLYWGTTSVYKKLHIATIYNLDIYLCSCVILVLLLLLLLCYCVIITTIQAINTSITSKSPFILSSSKIYPINVCIITLYC